MSTPPSRNATPPGPAAQKAHGNALKETNTTVGISREELLKAAISPVRTVKSG
jgi:hypothetical protein